ncbi:hypothetical protein ABZ897_07440 [Nonomuraea sp. NPDC046802]|uniref:hypothetical protein n=1 Tax=Nonomuraea sp. NPDC046802 TaxID=3154919 RepID=UPI0033DC4F24
MTFGQLDPENHSADGRIRSMSVPDLLWDDVKHLFDPQLNLALPDVVVEETTVDDWQALVDLVGSEGWRHAYSLGGEPMGFPSAAGMAAAASGTSESRLTPELRVWPVPEIQMVFRMYQPETIDFDVDLRELQGQERLNVLVDVLRAIGRRLGKSVLMYPEGSGDRPDLGFDVEAGRVVLMADPGVYDGPSGDHVGRPGAT